MGTQETDNLAFPDLDHLESKKAALKDEYINYVVEHPELKQIMSDFLSKILLDKPKDIPTYASSYFAGFLPKESQESPLIVCGPSGVGKGTLMKKLFAEFNGKLSVSVSHTTRQPRDGEVDGKHYHFVDKETMEREIAADQFIEYAHVHNNIYGTSFKAVKDVVENGQVCILEIDIQGVKKVKGTDLNPRVIYIAPPSVEELEKRLRERATEDEASIRVRMKNAEEEIDYLTQPGNVDFTVVNDDLDAAFEKLKAKVVEWYPHVQE